MDEHRLPPGQTAPLVESEMGQVEGKEEGRGLNVGELSGGFKCHRRRAGDQVGVGAGGTPAGRRPPLSDQDSPPDPAPTTSPTHSMPSV